MYQKVITKKKKLRNKKLEEHDAENTIPSINVINTKIYKDRKK